MDFLKLIFVTCVCYFNISKQNFTFRVDPDDSDDRIRDRFSKVFIFNSSLMFLITWEYFCVFVMKAADLKYSKMFS
jgi:hypothetical protein